MKKINLRLKRRIRFAWCDTQDGMIWLAGVAGWLVGQALGSTRPAKHRSSGRKFGAVSVEEVKLRPGSVYRKTWQAAPVAEYPVVKYPPTPVEQAVRRTMVSA